MADPSPTQGLSPAEEQARRRLEGGLVSIPFSHRDWRGNLTGIIERPTWAVEADKTIAYHLCPYRMVFP